MTRGLEGDKSKRIEKRGIEIIIQMEMHRAQRTKSLKFMKVKRFD